MVSTNVSGDTLSVTVELLKFNSFTPGVVHFHNASLMNTKGKHDIQLDVDCAVKSSGPLYGLIKNHLRMD